MIKKQLETEKDLNVTQEVRGLAARPASARLLEAARQTPQEVFAAYETTPQGQPRPDLQFAYKLNIRINFFEPLFVFINADSP